MNTENLAESSLPAKWQRMAEHVQAAGAAAPAYLRQFNKLVFSRLVTRNLVVFFLQYAGLMFSTLSSPFSIVWFASGTAAAFVFLRGNNIIPGIWLGSVLAYYSAGLGFERSCLCALILAIQAFLLVKLNYRSSILSLVFFQRSCLLKFLAYSALVSAVGSFSLASLCFSALPQTASFAQIFLEWWLANFNGTVILACALVSWDAYFPDLRKLKTVSKTKLLLFFAVLVVLNLEFLESKTVRELILFAFLNWLALFASGLIFKSRGLLFATFLLALFISFATLFEVPLFALPQPYLILGLEIFLASAAISGMLTVV